MSSFALTTLAASPRATPTPIADPIAPPPKLGTLSLTLEPYLGYQGYGGITEKIINSQFTTDIGSYFGFLFGAKALFEYRRQFFIGVDTSFSPSMGYMSTGGQAPSNNSTQAVKLGAILGADIFNLIPQLPLRAWMGYNFIDQITDSNNAANALSSSSSKIVFNGYSFRFGLGYQILSQLSLNFEYIYSIYSNVQSDTLSPGNSQVYPLPSTAYFGLQSLTNEMFVFTASAPFNFILKN